MSERQWSATWALIFIGLSCSMVLAEFGPTVALAALFAWFALASIAELHSR